MSRVVSRSIPPPWGVNPIPPSSPHVRPMGVHRTCGEPDEIKKNTHPKNITALIRDQVGTVTGVIGNVLPSPSTFPCRRLGR